MWDLLVNWLIGLMYQEGNYVTLSETSDEMYAAIDDNVYMDPQGAHGPRWIGKAKMLHSTEGVGSSGVIIGAEP